MYRGKKFYENRVWVQNFENIGYGSKILKISGPGPAKRSENDLIDATAPDESSINLINLRTIALEGVLPSTKKRSSCRNPASSDNVRNIVLFEIIKIAIFYFLQHRDSCHDEKKDDHYETRQPRHARQIKVFKIDPFQIIGFLNCPENVEKSQSIIRITRRGVPERVLKQKNSKILPPPSNEK
uniref:Ribosomal protein S3 n=1 Tax=Romanomermis culicivorax TaxID=13658 RepID=A0A915JWB1_ROMCU